MFCPRASRKVLKGEKANCKVVCIRWFCLRKRGGRKVLFSGKMSKKRVPLERELCGGAREVRAKIFTANPFELFQF